MFTLAVAQADAAHRHKPLITGSCDIPAAFINGNPLTRDHTGGVQLYTRMPTDLPAPYGGALCSIDGAQYGLRQSNNIYDQNLIKLLISHQYTPCPSHPYIMTKFDLSSDDPKDNIYVPLYVDDFEHYGTSQRLVDEFKQIITDRYGPVTFHNPSQGLCGQTHVLNPDKSITLHYGTYLSRVMDRIGMDKVPPSNASLVHPSTPNPFQPQQHQNSVQSTGNSSTFIPYVTTPKRSSPTYFLKARHQTTATTLNNFTSFDTLKAHLP